MNRFLLILVLAIVGGAAQAADAPANTTATGHPFIAPEGFALARKADAVLLTAPEGDSTVAIVDVDATSAEDAVAKAWAAARPEMRRPLKLATGRPDRNGWVDQTFFEYETSPNERATVYAIARHSTTKEGSSWVVVVVDGTDATMQKRAAPVGQLLASLRPRGFVRENLGGRKPHPLDAARIETLKRFVADGMKLLDVPGVGLSFIDGNRVVWEGGLGVKEKGRPDPVDAHTLFIAASNTKAMTTLLLALDVDAGKLRWDEPVVEAYPAFRLADPATTKSVLVKHLVCACTGMPRQDLEVLFNFRKRPARSTFDLLAQMTPTSRFGEVFQYSNLMVGAAGYIAADKIFPGVEPGAAYDRAMRERVFAPLGMNESTFDFARALATNHASPHGDTIDATTALAPMDLNYSFISTRPAGGLWTSPHDFSRFVLMELGRGVAPGGKRLVSEANLMERRKPQVLVGEDIQYGMGLFVDRHWGVEVVHHGGDLVGYHSDMIWLPEFGVGMTYLSNADAGVLLRGPLLRKFLEVLFDAKPEADASLASAAANRTAQAKKERERLVLPAAPDRAAALAGRYQSPALGNLVVRRRDGRVVFDFGDWKSEVASRINDDGTTSFITSDPSLVGFEFVVAGEGSQRALILRDAQHEYPFTEVPMRATNRAIRPGSPSP